MKLIGKSWNNTENQKKIHIYRDDQQAYYLQLIQIFNYLQKKKTNPMVAFSLSLQILDRCITDEIL